LTTGDLAGGFSDLEMTWLLYCAGAATGMHMMKDVRRFICVSAYNLYCDRGTMVVFHKFAE